MKNIKSSILVIIISLLFVLTPVLALAQTTDSGNTTDSNNTTNTTTSTDNSQDNDQDNDDINKEKVVVVCKTHNDIDDSANIGDLDSDVDSDGDQDSDQDTGVNTQPVVTGTATNTVDQDSTQTITQETTVDQLPSVVADFEQRGCDITVNYKTESNPDPVVVTNTNTIERVTTVEKPVTTQVVRTVTVPENAPETGGR